MTNCGSFTIEEAPWGKRAAALAAIRRAVFVEEQGVPESLEWDGLDERCEHVVAVTGDGIPIGTGRLLPDGHIGRMAVLRNWRGRGVGRALLQTLVARAKARGHEQAVLNAQCHAIDFYRREGFVVTSDEFLDAGIPHVEMRKDLREAPGLVV